MSKLMTLNQFTRLYNYLAGPMGCNFEDALDEPDGMTWDCDETLSSGPKRVDSTVAARYNEAHRFKFE